MGEFIEINSKEFRTGDADATLYGERERISKLSIKKEPSEVTVLVVAYNRLEKTKKCVESLLKYTADIDYDLWLVDNGSSDGTLEYFRSVPYEKKNILHITENKGAVIPYMFLYMGMFSEYVVFVANDLILTKNWLKNLLAVAKSDYQIGMVNPMSSNVSNLQDPYLQFEDEEDMQKKAEAFNVSDPRKWHERLRLITLGTLYKKECLFAIGFPHIDVGFAHNFADDDITFRVRRAGYKAILAGDTWIHHDDVKMNYNAEQAARFQQDLQIGRQNFIDKFNGIDAWDDVNNYIMEYLPALRPADDSGKESILGINVRCGTPILELKNSIKRFDVFDTDCYSYTTDPKYCADLQTVCGNENVQIGDIRELRRFYDSESFHHIVIGEAINRYEGYFEILEEAYRLLKPGGQLFVSVYNTRNLYEMIGCLGQYDLRSPVYAYTVSVDELGKMLLQKGISNRYLIARRFDGEELTERMIQLANSIVGKLGVSDQKTCLFRLLSKYYYVVLEKT